MKTNKHYKLGVKFLKFLELRKRLGTKTMGKMLNPHNPAIIKKWYIHYPKPIKILLNIYDKNYHKIKKEDLSRLFGWGFGDGGISYKLRYYFICGKKQDLLAIKYYLNKRIPSLSIFLEENCGSSLVQHANGKIKNISGKDTWILYMRDAYLCKLLYSFGLPKGEKVLQKVNIPSWIKKGDRKTKTAFLNSLFEGELQKCRVKYNKDGKKFEICPITIGFCKIKNYQSNLISFLNEIRTLLCELNIKSAKVQKPKPHTIRKDGFVTYFSRFFISTSAINIINFSKAINFPFNKVRREALLKSIIEAKIKLNKMNLQVKKYKKALKLFKKGLNPSQVSKKLDVGYCTARHWVKTKEHLPTLLNIN